MDLGLRNRVAAVAAASKGLGRGSANALAREGCRVVIGARGAKALADAVDELAAITGDPARVHGVSVDVVAEPEALVEAAVERFGTVEVLVPNAGGPPPAGALDVSADDLRAAFEANCVASIRMAHAAIPHMRDAEWGRICFITSSFVKQPAPFLALSNTARTGLVAFAKTLATDVAPFGITVNVILPGTHDTDRIRGMGSLDDLAASIPVGRVGSPADFGDAVAFLCSEQANFITGTTLLIDGGRYPGLL